MPTKCGAGLLVRAPQGKARRMWIPIAVGLEFVVCGMIVWTGRRAMENDYQWVVRWLVEPDPDADYAWLKYGNSLTKEA